jgi:ARG and Rhodanese-Phosphatase-superfamily-associated Protein domain
MKHSFLPMLAVLFTGFLVVSAANAGDAGSLPATTNDYKVLAPITHGDLTIFPVVSGKSHDTSDFITLDEGIRSGDVVVTEVGNLHSTMQRRPPYQPRPYRGAEVNRLVLVNNSKHPLILLAGEVVTGGKQDRVVGKDRIVPAESDPVDLSVFCVEHGRWTESSTKFDTHASVMLQPSVRMKAMADQDQQKVWDEVGRSRTQMSAALAAAPTVSGGGGGGVGGGSGTVSAEADRMQTFAELNGTTSYAKARENAAVKQQVDSIVEPMQKSYESVIKQLRNQNAVGVVVAVKGHIVWADMFASSALLAKYWPKLLDSYATEALTMPGARGEISIKEAEGFLQNWQARHEVVDSEPGLYRQRELIGDKFKAFQLTSLLAKEAFDLHLSKMAD